MNFFKFGQKHQEFRRRSLIIAMAINLVGFFVQLGASVLAHSVSLFADSLGLFADAFIYCISFYVFGRSKQWLGWAALVKALIIAGFSISVFIGVYSAILAPQDPIVLRMLFFATYALLVNGISLYFLAQHRNDDINLYSAFVAAMDDQVASFSVLIAALLVWCFNSHWPDIIMASFIACFMARSAIHVALRALRQLKFIG